MNIGYRTAAVASILTALQMIVAPSSLMAEKSVNKLKKRLRRTEHNAGQSLLLMAEVLTGGQSNLPQDEESLCTAADECSTLSLDLSISKAKPKLPPLHPAVKHPEPKRPAR